MEVRGKLSFTGVVSVTLNFHTQGRNVNDVTNEGESLISLDRVTVTSLPPTFQLFPSLVTSFTFLPWR